MNNFFQIASWSILIYGVLVLLGGLIGYLKAKSQVSLLSGLGSGLALIAAWFVSRQVPQIGMAIATLIALVLCVVFVMRFLRTRAFMPSGMMMIFSLGATVVFVIGLLGTSGALI